jgi:mRNA interferase RelE/StbE
MAAKERRRVLKRCLELGSGPFPEGKRVKQMRGFEPALYRLRVGDYRVLYRVEEDRVVLLAVIHRSELDRALNSLR